MKYFLLFIVFVENFVLYGFRPWGQEKAGWTLLTGILMLFSVVVTIILSIYEGKKEEEQKIFRKKAGF